MTKSRFILLIFALNALVKFGNSQINSALAILKDVGSMNYTTNIASTPKKLSPQEITLEMKKVLEKLNETRYDMNDGVKKLWDELFLHFNNEQGEKKETLEEFNSYINLLDPSLKNFDSVMAVMASQEVFIPSVLDDYFSSFLLGSSMDVQRSLGKIYKLIEGNGTNSYFEQIIKYVEMQIETGGADCGSKKISQAHIYNFYSILVDKTYRGYLLLILAYKYATIRSMDDFESDIRHAKNIARLTIFQYTSAAYKAMKTVTNIIVACDGTKDIKNETYIELNGFSQGFIFEAEALTENRKFCEGDHLFGEACSTNLPQCFDYECTRTGGFLKNCRHIKENSIKVCPATDSSKRYSWIRTDNDWYYGNHSRGDICSVPLAERTVKPGEDNDQFCFCHCVRTMWKASDIRSISLMWVEADYTSNRVITDIKFVEKNGMIHLQAQQGRITVGGMIDQSTVSWIDIPDVKALKSKRKEPIYTQFDEVNKESFIEWRSTEQFDYVSNGLTVNLDDIIAPEGHVIVGVSLTTDLLNFNTIELEISTMKFDYRTGNLDFGDKVIITATNYLEGVFGKNSRTPIDLGKPNNPVNSKISASMIAKPHQSVTFEQTDMEKDLGQSIVPFFDIRPVKPNPAVPLSGMGIYYRGCKDCGGFIAPKLISFDFTKILSEDWETVDLLDPYY